MDEIGKSFEEDLGKLISRYKTRDSRFLESELAIRYDPKSNDLDVAFSDIGMSKILNTRSMLEIYLSIRHDNMNIDSLDHFDKYMVTGLTMLIERIFSDFIFEIRTPMEFCLSLLILLEEELKESESLRRSDYLNKAMSRLESIISYINEKKHILEEGNSRANKIGSEEFRKELEDFQYAIFKKLESS
ncbi:hypothetical protein [Pontibacter sp. G13]|uniref:hypothetical protein n=1 Tax=Pontibacter sp. G13 TaxID=3074898 RepID=UPI00288A1F86|nr:hypothetical protein [Pontibacter sp. G13]WNJ21553.1 hypothetical protein RJD25_28755 [Pontibacter sp. G13]